MYKTTWHGPHRSSEECEEKLEYGFDAPEPLSPERLVARIEQAGFALRHETICACEPASYVWHSVQTCIFDRL